MNEEYPMFKRENTNIYERGLEELPEQEGEETLRPNLLDVVKIDGRWAQVMAGGDAVRFLDNREATEIDWNNYILTKKWKERGFTVKVVKEIEPFTKEELENIHYGPEEKNGRNFDFNGEVRVFGDYQRKKERSETEF